MAQALRLPASMRAALLLLLVCQLVIWWQVRGIAPALDIVPEVPTTHAAQAMSLGDEQFYFRWLALNVQNSGDTYGRFTALRDYDYARLYAWLELLDRLDSHSNMMPSMAAYYFSQTQKTQDVRYLVDYLYQHATRDIGNKWWWLIQAGYLAQHKLKDMDLALKVTKPLLNPAVPVWAQQMLAVVHESRGEMDDALNIMESIRDNARHIPDADLRYMEYFVRERLHKLDEFNQNAPKTP
jgi:hypothetical protein